MRNALRPLRAAVLTSTLLFGRVAEAAPPSCNQPFAVGSALPEPGPAQRIARIFSLRGPSGRARVGTLYLTTTGATYYLSETVDVTPRTVAIEMSYLEAAGYMPNLARQYTHLAEIPAVPPVAHAFDLAKRRGLRVISCP